MNAGALTTLESRLAAMPVGATRRKPTLESFKIETTARIVVVLPVPGKPVMRDTLSERADSAAEI